LTSQLGAGNLCSERLRHHRERSESKRVRLIMPLAVLIIRIRYHAAHALARQNGPHGLRDVAERTQQGEMNTAMEDGRLALAAK